MQPRGKLNLLAGQPDWHVACCRQIWKAGRRGRGARSTIWSPACESRASLPLCWVSRYLLLPLILFFLGCSALDRYMFVPKVEIHATPEKYRIAYQNIWFTSSDAVPLNGWFLPGAPGLPLVVFFHGNAGNLSDNLEYLKLLHVSGFSVFIFDYRGFGSSGGEPLHENDLYRDARGALNFLHREGWSNKEMIFFGQSLGSAVALQMALESKPRGLVLESSFSTMKEMVKRISPFIYSIVGWWTIGHPFDNLDKIARIGVPLLLIHGDRDTIVPLEMTQRLFARAREPKQLHIIAGGGHCDVFAWDSRAYLTAWSS